MAHEPAPKLIVSMKPEFYVAIVWLHIIDFFWFAILYAFSGRILVPGGRTTA